MAPASAFVPVKQLPDTDRTREIRKVFHDVFNNTADFYVRVPGRVNLIGEHIDYCGYPVCPMALDQHILLAVSKTTDKILTLHNTDAKFKDFECSLENFEISIGEGKPKWYQYFLCGVKGILDCKEEPSSSEDLVGMKVVVSGNIPHSAGLSSSSALVSAAALATAYANNRKFTKERLAELCATCERYIGTQGGGMDQAIAFLAEEGCAKLIEFMPLRSTDVTLPAGAVFVIAHSLANLNKAATSDFNRRVVECRLATKIIAQRRDLSWQEIKNLSDIQKAQTHLTLHDMIAMAKSILHEEPYSKEEVAKELGISVEQLENTLLTPNTKNVCEFKLSQRALHVFQEALRVKDFYRTCLESNGSNEKTLVTIGRLMSESHLSLERLYECSHARLNELVDASAGYVYGARLTGAGWGGCIVALVKNENLKEYMEHLKETFYKKYCDGDDFEKFLFSTAPKSGACIYV